MYIKSSNDYSFAKSTQTNYQMHLLIYKKKMKKSHISAINTLAHIEIFIGRQLINEYKTYLKLGRLISSKNSRKRRS